MIFNSFASFSASTETPITASSTEDSPTKVSPTTVFPTEVSPTNVSPTKVSSREPQSSTTNSPKIPPKSCESRPCEEIENTECIDTSLGEFVCKCSMGHLPIHNDSMNGCKGNFKKYNICALAPAVHEQISSESC